MIALVADGSLGAVMAHSFQNDSCSDSAESSEDEIEKVSNDNFRPHYLVGGSGAGHFLSPPGCAHVPIDEFVGYLSKPEMVGRVDVMELFGGEGDVGKFCARRRLKRGANFDVVAGCDLTKPDHQRELLRYVEIHGPFVILMGPLALPSGIERI